MTDSALKNAIRNFPHRPGIYIFSAKGGKSLYIGKALDLKNRVKNYLKTRDIRLKKMIVAAKKIDYIETDSDTEALILESQYIKKFKPAFNIMLRDDKQYSFVGLTEEKFPKIFITHQPTKQRSSAAVVSSNISKKGPFSTALMPSALQPEFIGPFTDIGALKTTLRYLRRIFPYCTCKQLHNNYCLNYHIGKCIGICCLKLKSKNEKVKITIQNSKLKEYRKNIKVIKNILSGKKTTLIKNVGKEMVAAGKQGEFDKAIELREKIEKIKRVFENAKIISSAKIIPSTNNFPWKIICRELMNFLKLLRLPHRIEGYDIANIQGKYAVGAMVVFSNGKPDKSEYRKFKILTKQAPDDTAMLKEILIRRFNHSEWLMPDLIVVDGGKAQLSAALKAIPNFEFLISKKISIITLTKNEKHKGEKIYVARPSKGRFAFSEKKSTPLSQLPTSVKNLLLQIDSEAHRFAISYYRKLHGKAFR